jgi:hypothetical protein
MTLAHINEDFTRGEWNALKGEARAVRDSYRGINNTRGENADNARGERAVCPHTLAQQVLVWLCAVDLCWLMGPPEVSAHLRISGLVIPAPIQAVLDRADTEAPRLTALCAELREALRSNARSRVLVFVDSRDLASRLSRWLQDKGQLGEGLQKADETTEMAGGEEKAEKAEVRVERVVGHGGSEGMEWTGQEAVLKRFKKGETQVSLGIHMCRAQKRVEGV